MTSSPRAVALVALGVVAFGLATLATSREWPAPTLLFDGASYVALAEHIRAHWFVPPPSLNLRPPLYPTVIAIAGWLTGGDGLAAVVHLQTVAWLLVGVLVMLWVSRVSGSLAAGALCGCLHYTLPQAFFNIGLVYAETLAVALAVGAGLALSASLGAGRHARALTWLAAALALAAAHTRPIFQLLLPLFGAVALIRRPRAADALASTVPFVVAALVGLGPFYLANALVKGTPSFVSVTGHTLANYLGDRRLLGKFPREHEAVQALYTARFAADAGLTRVPWWEVAGDWERLVQTRTGRMPSWGVLDREMSRTAVAVLAANPDYYLRRWREAWIEFSTATGPSVAGAFCPINLLAPLWRAYWGAMGTWSPIMILALELANVVHRGRTAVVRLVPIATYLAVGLVNTAIEPWPGQIRYRSQVDAFLLISLGLAALLVLDRVRRWRG